MTDDERELAEYVARWAGYDRQGGFGFGGYVMAKGNWVRPLDSFLTDRALAMRALEEVLHADEGREISLAELKRIGEAHEYALCGSPPIGWHYADSLELAIFRAHRAVFGGDGDG